MNKQHTPKPWGITSRNWSFRIQPQSNDPAENEANIRLIRVAPELLEALEALLESAKSANASLNWATGLNDEPASFDQARTAIRKARGE